MEKYISNCFFWKICLFFVVVFVACDKDYMTYDTSQKPGLYSANEKSGDIDTLRLTSKITEDTVVARFYFTVLGMPVNYEREIALEVLGANIPKGEYQVKNNVVKAGEVQAIVTVEFYNDLNMEGEKRYIVFQVIDNNEFRILKEFTPNKYYVLNEIVGQSTPKWWRSEYLGPFSISLYERMVSTFVRLKDSDPSLYDVMSASLGKRLENEPTDWVISWGGLIEVYIGEMWTKYKYPMVKNVLYPLWEYYQEHPEEGVNIPKPNLVI